MRKSLSDGLEMGISDNGIKLLRKWEGVKPLPYLDVAGNWTIGIGHLLTKDELSSGRVKAGRGWVSYRGINGLSDYYMNDLLKNDLVSHEKTVNTKIKVPLNQNQFDALVSFAFNVGNFAFKRSTLAKILNKGDYEGVPKQLRRWVYAAGKQVDGLKNRRSKEIRLWNKVA